MSKWKKMIVNRKYRRIQQTNLKRKTLTKNWMNIRFSWWMHNRILIINVPRCISIWAHVHGNYNCTKPFPLHKYNIRATKKNGAKLFYSQLFSVKVFIWIFIFFFFIQTETNWKKLQWVKKVSTYPQASVCLQ